MDCISSLGVYPTIDFDFWVKHGSWKMCPCCCSMYFDDKYFREVVYQTVRTTSRADEASCFVGHVPNEPVEHVEGAVGVMSRWWYNQGMYGMGSLTAKARLCSHCPSHRRRRKGKTEG